MNKKPPNKAGGLGTLALVILVIVFTIFMLNLSRQQEEVRYSDVRRFFVQEEVRAFRVEGNTIYLYLHDAEENDDPLHHVLHNFSLFFADLHELVVDQYERDVIEWYNYRPAPPVSWWIAFLPYVLLVGLFLFVWYIMMNRAGGGGEGRGAMRFGKARTRVGTSEHKKKIFDDVAGADEEKAELQEIVDYLKSPAKYTQLGARIPKGVLLVGPPGTGKTLIAKAVAGEAGVQFLSISGSDFVELYVGVGASRVRDLFDQAKKVAPCIIFIDEIDAVGRQRGAGMGGGHDEREQTLNQLLVEMDGFDNNEGVIVIAATNRQDILDSALLRPGRFDRQVYVGLPDVRGREAILRVHAKGKPLGDDVDLASLARGTPGFTGADLENLLNEAALLAARHGRQFTTMAEMEEAILKVIAGPEKKSRVVTEKTRKLTAYHEAGHAVSAWYLKHVDPVHHITIIPRGGAGGMTIYRPQEDKTHTSKSEMFEYIITCMGGRVAEKLFLDDISTGAVGDIQQATGTARAMVMQYGMSDKIGPISFDSSASSVFIGRDFAQTKAYSEQTAAAIDAEIKHIFDTAMARCEEILNKNSEIVVKTATYLLEHETMDGNVFTYLCKHGELPVDVLEQASLFSGSTPAEESV